ncbi:hypothetical protein [Chryseobacterium sp. MFBS3-17]|uniref:hypothetical protein n=1 Tax=Chryseobacterium sp. MFBS3-17 TaxID=2886689 RepID=UPI001D0E3A49|nr:hypothetical protein [Chryseobacterium sp. MFBS3-17]MCC2590373.1 hypothetical protein [Chryseobacterium sp. MFBS3-17]
MAKKTRFAQIGGGTASQFVKGDGTFDSSAYAFQTGSNGTGPWSHGAQLIINNGAATAHTLNAAGATVSLLDATNGHGMGYLNTAGTATGNPSADWYYRIKMLHPNLAGYNGQIALQMTGLGSGSLWFKSVENGTDLGWRQAVDTGTDQMIPAKKRYISTGNSFTDHALEVYSTSAADPGIAFHKAGVFGGVLKLTSTGYQFMDISGTGFRPVEADGFVHRAYGGNNPNRLLDSAGGMVVIGDDLTREGNGLRLNPRDEDLVPSGGWFDHSEQASKLVYLRSKAGEPFDLYEISHRTRLILINYDGSALSSININGNYIRKLSPMTKVSLYVTPGDEYIFYDETQIEIF